MPKRVDKNSTILFLSSSNECVGLEDHEAQSCQNPPRYAPTQKSKNLLQKFPRIPNATIMQYAAILFQYPA